MLQKLEQPIMVDRVKEAFDISIQYPVHTFAGDRHTQRIKRVVLAATRPKAITETHKILLINRLQDPNDGLLDDLVLQRSDPQQSFPTIGFGNADSQGRLCSVGASVNTLMEVDNVRLQILLIVLPCHFINSNGHVFLQIEERFTQTIFVDVV
jgi:hypothetical protein